MTRISVIIPTCGRPALLERALASVCAQDRPPAEVIVVDDGDVGQAGATRAVVERFHARGVRLIANAGRQGASAARNRGAAAATGTLLAFLDDDDEWLPPYLGEAARRFESDGIDVLCTDLLYRYDDGTERPGKSAPDRLATEAFLTRNPGLVGSNLVIRRTLYGELGGFDESLPTSEDMDFGIRLSLHAATRYAPLHQRLVRHYQHTRERLCVRRGAAMRAGIARFFALHGSRMSPVEQERFRRAVRELWGIDEYGRDAETSLPELPRVSVVVAVYNGQATLAECLDSLVQLDYPAGQLELLCVDNGSTDATPRILASYGDRLRVVREAMRGPAAARNRGVRQASGDVVAFTDADCVVERGWLRNLVAPLRDPRVGVVGGRILSRRPCNPIEAFGERIHDHARALNELSPPYAITMNWASRRAVLERIGMFNAALLRSSDVECSYRMVEAGYRLVYEPGAVVYHRNERTPWGLLHEGYVHGFHAPRVQRIHAEFLRRMRAERVRAVAPAASPAAEQWSDALLWSLFRFGKRVGRWHASWSSASHHEVASPAPHHEVPFPASHHEVPSPALHHKVPSPLAGEGQDGG